MFDEQGAVKGVRIGDMGLDRDGQPGPNYTPGVEIHAKLTVLAEGCRGSVSKQLIAKYDLAAGHCPQTYALGIKELWQLPPGRVQPGRIEHASAGRSTRTPTAAASSTTSTTTGCTSATSSGLDYEDPRLAPFEAFQQFKNHPSVKPLLEGGEIVSAGARTIAAGGWQSMPTLEMPGAMLIGDAGGTLNFAKIKGMHQAIRSAHWPPSTLPRPARGTGFDARWRASPGGQELKRVRNFKPAFKRGMWFGLANSAWETVTGGKSPWTLKNSADFARLKKLDEYTSPDRHWGERTLPPRDRVSFVFFAGNTHDENQPVHLKVADTSICAEPLRQGIRQSLRALLPGRRLRDGGRRRGRQPSADQCRQLRALQGLRHQGSLRDHHLDDARGRLGSELPVVVGWPARPAHD